MHFISEVVGHHSIDFTGKTYARFSPASASRAILRVLEDGGNGTNMAHGSSSQETNGSTLGHLTESNASGPEAIHSMLFSPRCGPDQLRIGRHPIIPEDALKGFKLRSDISDVKVIAVKKSIRILPKLEKL